LLSAIFVLNSPRILYFFLLPFSFPSSIFYGFCENESHICTQVIFGCVQESINEQHTSTAFRLTHLGCAQFAKTKIFEFICIFFEFNFRH
jgi:hypothetical protein